MEFHVILFCSLYRFHALLMMRKIKQGNLWSPEDNYIKWCCQKSIHLYAIQHHLQGQLSTHYSLHKYILILKQTIRNKFLVKFSLMQLLASPIYYCHSTADGLSSILWHEDSMLPLPDLGARSGPNGVVIQAKQLCWWKFDKKFVLIVCVKSICMCEWFSTQMNLFHKHSVST